MSFFNFNSAELLRLGGRDPNIPARVQAIIKIETTHPRNLSYEFDFSSDYKQIVRYYGANATFYEVDPAMNEEKAIDSHLLLDIVRRAKGDIYGTLVLKKYLTLPTESPTEILHGFLKIGLRATRKIITPEYAREHLAYGPAKDTVAAILREQQALSRIYGEKQRKINFVFSQFDESLDEGEYAFFLLDTTNGHDTLLAHCFLKYQPMAPFLVTIERVASFYPGACKRLSTAVADALLADGKIYVHLQSINVAAHVCYLRSFLGRFKYAVLFHKGMSLIDESNIDTWLKLHSDASVSSGFVFLSSIYMYYVRDSDILLAIAGDRIFAWNESGGILSIHCKLDTNATGAVDIFLSKNTGRRVLYVPNEEELRGRLPAKRQKMTISEEEHEEEKTPRSGEKERAE
jgi:hypothetical protein